MGKLLDLYFKLFNALTSEHLKKGHYQAWQAHTQIVTVISTGLLMWTYAILAHLKINHPVPAIVGYAMAATHLLSPLLLRWPGNILLASHILIGSGIIHQATFAYFTGGFNSNIIIWFGILPMLGGIMLGRMGVVVWAIITTLVSASYLYIDAFGPGFPKLIDEQGWLIAQAMMVFGWIFLSTILIYVFILLMEHNDNQQMLKNNKIRTLVRVLCHDISNPLTIIKNRLQLIKRKLEDEEASQGVSKVEKPVEAIQGIIEQIRNWEAIDSGKKEVQLEAVCLNETLEFIEDIFDEKLKDKEIKLNIDIPTDKLLIQGDKTTLQSQIFSNIVSNAIKFSDPGSEIDIIIKDEGDTVVASIADKGLGIPDSLLEDLFDATKKTNRLGTNGEKGTGFGLPIVKAYVEKFGGIIKVDSKCREKYQNNSGTTFQLAFKKFDTNLNS